MNRTKIDIPKEKIDEFCQKWKIVELSLFGSVLRDDFRSDSDVDMLVTFSPDAEWSLLDHVAMEEELSVIFGKIWSAAEQLNAAKTTSAVNISSAPFKPFMWRDEAYLLDILMAARKVLGFTRVAWLR